MPNSYITSFEEDNELKSNYNKINSLLLKFWTIGFEFMIIKIEKKLSILKKMNINNIFIIKDKISYFSSFIKLTRTCVDLGNNINNGIFKYYF